MNFREMKGNLLLLLTALIWGCAFVAQSVSANYVGAFTFQAVRSIIGAVVLVPVMLVMDAKKKKNGSYTVPTGESRKMLIKSGIICGIILFIASNLQQIGIKYTTAGKAGFITALYIVIVPVIGIFMKKKPSPKIWFCILIALVGLYLLSVTDGCALSMGDIMVLLCAVTFSFHIIVVDHYAPLVDGVRLSCIQFIICGGLSGIMMFTFEKPEISNIMDAAIPILYAGVLSCGVAYTLQIIGQKYTRPTVASLLMSLESVFAVLAGMVVLREIPTPREAVGCVLMFAAIVITQIPIGRKEKVLK